MRVLKPSDGILMNVVLNLLDQLNLTTLAIDGNGVWVSSAKEVLEDLKGITAESICLLAAQFAWDAILEHLFSISVICFSQFGYFQEQSSYNKNIALRVLRTSKASQIWQNLKLTCAMRSGFLSGWKVSARTRNF